MSRHLLHRGQVDAQVEEIPYPGPAQIMRCGSLDLGLAAALAADLPGRCRTEPSLVLTGPGQTSGLDHGAKERARL
jgi:hypothetical protein